MHIKIKAGMSLRIAGAAVDDVVHEKAVYGAAVLGRDFPGVRFELLAEQGRAVRAGEALMCDRNRPDIVFTSPITGTVGSIHRGARRALVSLGLVADGSDEAVEFDIPEPSDANGIRRLMLTAGLWPSLRARPFGRIPDPDAKPKALLVTAIDTEPLAPDPAPVVTAHAHAFVRGLEALSRLSDAPLYLCKAPGDGIPAGVPDGVRVAEFAGRHPAGLAGTHIHALCHISFDGAEAWHIGYQDVIALGILMETGRPWPRRIVALAGPSVAHPRLVAVPPGAAVDDVVEGELTGEGTRVIAGSVLSGHPAVGAEAYLGHFNRQITALPEAAGDNLLPWRRSVADTALGGEPGPLIPTGDFERVAPPGILPVPLLRALLVGDVDRARDLGALELIEEDMMLLSYVCPSKSDYASLLRRVLEQLCKEAA